jgi:fluoroacetyl-CoA thioesterase
MSLPFSTEAQATLLGTTGRAALRVEAADTAISAGSGDIPVLATPRMIALMEAAACEALRGHLGPDTTSVGTKVDIAHLKPSPVGADVTATAVITRIDGDRIDFDVTAEHAPTQLIGRGTHTRVVVERGPFMKRMQ